MSVTAARGFRAAGVAAGLKPAGALDLALVVNDGPTDAAAGVFTSNRVKAAPVLWSQQVLATGSLRAVILNSGGANACTGRDGFADTHHTAETTAAALDLGAAEVAVCSTGVIGERLPMPKLLAGIDRAAASLTDDGAPAAQAIMTTDTVPKTSTHTGNGWSVGGMAKGAGMLAPALATMLCIITTDAAVDSSTVDKALRDAAARTFDRIDSDGCMSTNDTVILMAGGASGITPDYGEFQAAVESVCHDLAMQLIADAEGACKRIEIAVRGAATEADALQVGKAVAGNALLKCAIYGNDPYWGRVLAAVGTTRAAFEPDRIDVAFNGVQVCTAGTASPGRPAVDISDREVAIGIDLHAGEAEATVWTTDLTPEYVHENSAYTT